MKKIDVLLIMFIMFGCTKVFGDALTQAKDKLAIEQAQYAQLNAQKSYQDAVYQEKADAFETNIPNDAQTVETIRTQMDAQINQINQADQQINQVN